MEELPAAKVTLVSKPTMFYIKKYTIKLRLAYITGLHTHLVRLGSAPVPGMNPARIWT